MKTVTHPLLSALLFLSAAHVTAAQSVDEIVERHLAASGGRAALEKLTSRRITGTITLTTPLGDLSGPIEVDNQKPARERTLITLDLTALGASTLTVDRRFDGAAGFVRDTLQGDRDLTGLELQNMRNNATTFPNPFLMYKPGGTSLTLRGREKVGEREAYVLIAESGNGATSRVYIDAETYLSIKAVSMAEAPQVGQFEQTTELLDYRDVDGIKVPFLLKSTSSAQSFTIAVTKVEHNVTVDPSVFARPAQ